MVWCPDRATFNSIRMKLVTPVGKPTDTKIIYHLTSTLKGLVSCSANNVMCIKLLVLSPY